MKGCPECRRTYYDDSLRYCLDDGAMLLDGPSSEKETVVLKGRKSQISEPIRVLQTKTRSDSHFRGAETLPSFPKAFLLIGLLISALVITAYYLITRQTAITGQTVTDEYNQRCEEEIAKRRADEERLALVAYQQGQTGPNGETAEQNYDLARKNIIQKYQYNPCSRNINEIPPQAPITDRRNNKK